MDKISPLFICYCLVFISTLARCDLNNNLTQTSEITGQGQRTCKDLVGCVHMGLLTGLGEIENSEVYPFFGRRLLLEKTSDFRSSGGQQDMGKMGVIKRAYHLLDTHVVRVPLIRSLSFKLFRTSQGPFDVALEISEPTTAGNGRTFFKHRLQMALLPIMYKMGVMTTLLGALVVMVMKGLVISVILLVIAVSSAVKHKLEWQHAGHHQSTGWSAPSGGYYLPAPVHHSAPQDIHVHLHGITKETIHHKEDHHATSGHGGISSYGQQQTSGSGGDPYLSPYNRAAHEE